MKDYPPKTGRMQTILLIVVTGTLMVAGGIGAYVMAIMFLMNLGLKLHVNYEYYGQTPAVSLLVLAGALGFLAPGITVWYLRSTELPLRFSLRTLLLAI